MLQPQLSIPSRDDVLHTPGSLKLDTVPQKSSHNCWIKRNHYPGYLSYWITCPVCPFKTCIAVPKYPKIFFFFALRCKLIDDKKLNIKIIFSELICITQKNLYMLKRFYQMSIQLLLSSRNTQVTISTGCANGTQFMIGDTIILLMKTQSPFIWGAGGKGFPKQV